MRSVAFFSALVSLGGIVLTLLAARVSPDAFYPLQDARAFWYLFMSAAAVNLSLSCLSAFRKR